jgi:hypothetical protein
MARTLLYIGHVDNTIQDYVQTAQSYEEGDMTMKIKNNISGPIVVGLMLFIVYTIMSNL